uniref:LolSALOe n=1 Tax=Bichromomyia olmeca TaxID=715919 RepID=A0A1B1V3E3_9DIPT|nr:LolSALOe [Bichromomyia olmeca]
MKWFVLTLILFLIGSIHVEGSCRTNLINNAVKLFNRCKQGHIKDEFFPFSETTFKNFHAEGIKIAKKCLAVEAGSSHGKCKRFFDLKDCYMEENLCQYVKKIEKPKKSKNSKKKAKG